MKIEKHVFYGAEGRYVAEAEFDRILAERDTLQQRLNAVEEENDRLRNQPAQHRRGEPVAPVINAEQVLGAYQFASFGPANHLRGTTNWCAVFAQELNHRIGADTTEVERIGNELREVREERDDLRRRVDDFQSRSHGIKNLSVIEQMNDKLAERDALLREVLVGLWPSTPMAIKINAALSASAEPSAPVERDERAAFELVIGQKWPGIRMLRINRPGAPADGEYELPVLEGAWQGWQSRAALERKP